MKAKETYRKLAERSGHAGSELLLEILARAMTPEEAAFLVELPAASADLAVKFGIDEKMVEDKIQQFMKRGLVIPSRKGSRFPNDLSFLRDEMLSSTPESIPPELPHLWKEFYDREWRQEIIDILSVMELPSLRALPAQRAVPPGVELLPWENMELIIGAARSVAVRNCPCRVMVEGCDSPIHNCIQFNRRADFALGRGSSKRISSDEVAEITLSAEEAGLVPIVANIGTLERMDYVCYCCSCCCSGLEPLKWAGKLSTYFAKSRFSASVDQEACNGCQVCLERCHFDAIEMEKVPNSKKLKATVDTEKCFGCGLCVLKCKPAAIMLKVVRPPEHIPGNNVAVIP